MTSREPSEWSFSVDSNGLPTISFRGAPVVKTQYAFWGAKWKWAGAQVQRKDFSADRAGLSGKINALGITLDGSIENKPAHQLTYRMTLNASRDLKEIIGGGFEFRLQLHSPAFAEKANDPELLPDNRGWKWQPAAGQEVLVEFAEPIASVYFESGRKNQIRTMFVGQNVQRGQHTLNVTITLPAGSRRVLTPAERYGPTDIKSWHPDVLAWNRSPVDLSFLNHKPAGKHGFVRAKGDELVFEDGTPARFWGGNLAAYALFRPKAEIEEQARRIAQLGFNLMRIHHHDSTGWVNPTVIDKKLNDSQHFDPAGLDGVDYWIKCFKEQGVYVWLDLHVGRQLKAGDQKTEQGQVASFSEIMRRKGDVKGFCYYDPGVQTLMKEFQEKYLSRVNPYTKLAYKDDPAIMGLLITNENDLTSHFGNLALPDKGNPVLNRLFNERLKAFCAASGLDASKAWQTWLPGESKIFLNEQEHRFNQIMLASLKSVGVRVPVSTTNTWGNMGLLSLPALTDGDIIDVHKYDGPEALSRNPRYQSNIASWIGAAQVSGKPLSITEWNIVENDSPAADRFTAPLYVASIGCLQGWDAPMVYNYSQTGFSRPTRQYTWSTFADPGMTAIMPAAAIAFRQGHIAPARNEFCLKLNRRQLYYDNLNPDSSRAIRTLVETSKLTIGLPDIPELDWDRETKPAPDVTVIADPNQDFIPTGRSAVESDTGELRRDWTKGFQTINTPRTQAAQGWIGAEEIDLNDVRMQIKTAKAVVAVTALDDEPVRSSRRILITTLARVVAPNGKTPFYSEPVIGKLSIRARSGLSLTPLNADGSQADELEAVYDEEGRYAIMLDGRQVTHWYLLHAK